MAVSAPTIIQKPASRNNYTVGRIGGRNGQQTFHHVVGSADSAAAVFQNPSRQASATYIVTATPGVVYQSVGEGDTSWADGNMLSNRRAITVEHHGDWRNGYRNETVIKNAAQLVAWLRDRGIVNHYYRHRDVSQIGTICSADLPVEEIWNKATEIIKKSKKPVPAPITKASLVWEKLPKTTTYEMNKKSSLWNFNSTTYQGMKSIKLFNSGDRVDIYGTVTNKSVGSVYLLTEYSYSNKITNGFNKLDLDVYTKPAKVKLEWELNLKSIVPIKLQVLTPQTPIVNLIDNSVVKQLGGGTWVDFVKSTTVGGVEYLISSWSNEGGVANGIKRTDVGIPVQSGNEKPAWLEQWQDINDIDMYVRADTDLVDLNNGKTIKVLPLGAKIRVSSTTEWFGHKYAITEYSTDRKEGRGIRMDDLDLKQITPPSDQAPYQPPIKTIDSGMVTAFLEMLVELIKQFINKIRGPKE